MVFMLVLNVGGLLPRSFIERRLLIAYSICPTDLGQGPISERSEVRLTAADLVTIHKPRLPAAFVRTPLWIRIFGPLGDRSLPSKRRTA